MAAKGLLVVALSGLLAPLAAYAVHQYSLQIERQSVVHVLRDLSKQTGLQIVAMFPAGTNEGSRLAGPLRGEFSAESALQLLLADSNLTFVRVNANTITVTAKPPAKTDQSQVRTSAR